MRPDYVFYDETELPGPAAYPVMSECPSVDHARNALGSDLVRMHILRGAERGYGSVVDPNYRPGPARQVL